jgi:hypothetical protein
LLTEIEGFPWSASSSFFARWFCFPTALTPIRTCDRSRSSNLINAISVEEEQGRAQSKPTHAKGIRSRLGTGQRPRSKMFLFLFRRVLLSVPLANVVAYRVSGTEIRVQFLRIPDDVFKAALGKKDVKLKDDMKPVQ